MTVLGVFFDYATDGGKLVIDRSLYHRWWNDESVTLFPIYVVSGADPGQVRSAILEPWPRDAGADVPDGADQCGFARRSFVFSIARSP